eukprot:m.420820 g.420820  ORF g.420820 m.420820 type:complete len:278 (-) comp32942_c0_seq1:106-939(-)
MDNSSSISRRYSNTSERVERKSEEAVKKLLDAISLGPGLGTPRERPLSRMRSSSSASSRLSLSAQSHSSSSGWEAPLDDALAKARVTRQIVSFRVWDADAINAPGVQYKAVAVTSEMTAGDLITECISKCGSKVDPIDCELHFAVDYDDSVPKKKRTEPAKVLEADECPYLVAEWYTDLPRRFEIHPINTNPEKSQRKFYKYWNSPVRVLSVRRRSSTVKGLDKNKSRRSSRSGSSIFSRLSGSTSSSKTLAPSSQSTSALSKNCQSSNSTLVSTKT